MKKKRILTKADLVEEVVRQVNETKGGLVFEVDSEHVKEVKKMYSAMKGLGMNTAIRTEKGVLSDNEVDKIGPLSAKEVFIKHHRNVHRYNEIVMSGLKDIITHQENIVLPEYLYLELFLKWASKEDRPKTEIVNVWEKIELNKLSYWMVADIAEHLDRVNPSLEIERRLAAELFGFREPVSGNDIWSLQRHVFFMDSNQNKQLFETGSLIVSNTYSSVKCSIRSCGKRTACCYHIKTINDRYHVLEATEAVCAPGTHTHSPGSILHFWVTIQESDSERSFKYLSMLTFSKTDFDLQLQKQNFVYRWNVLINPDHIDINAVSSTEIE